MNQPGEQPDQTESGESWTPRDALLAVAAFVVIAAIAVGGYLFYMSSKAPPVDVDTEAPDFTFPLLNGGEASLSDYRGKVVLVNIWATWCNPCREEMPSMQTLYQMMQGRPFEILAVSIDSRGAEDVEPFVKQLGLTFPVLLDQEGDMEGLYQTSGVPESFIIDADGIVRDRIIGPVNWSSTSTEEYQLIEHLTPKSP
jgi:cytochrome c biogenesis protein CcmG/thiol:disulfide interchange protein DsbE